MRSIFLNQKFLGLNILTWEINFVVKSITSSFIMLNIMMENEITSFANISIPFLRSFSQHYREHDLRKGIKILARILLFN